MNIQTIYVTHSWLGAIFSRMSTLSGGSAVRSIRWTADIISGADKANFLFVIAKKNPLFELQHYLKPMMKRVKIQQLSNFLEKLRAQNKPIFCSLFVSSNVFFLLDDEPLLPLPGECCPTEDASFVSAVTLDPILNISSNAEKSIF